MDLHIKLLIPKPIMAGRIPQGYLDDPAPPLPGHRKHIQSDRCFEVEGGEVGVDVALCDAGLAD